MKWVLLAPALLALAACGTPQQQCINQTARDLVVVDDQIAETEANIARGFRYESTTQFVSAYEPCFGPPSAAHFYARPLTCAADPHQTVQRPVAIDMNSERAKLAALRNQRDQLARQHAPAIAACKARYPA